MAKPLIGLYQEHISNLRSSLTRINEHFDMLVTPIVNPLYYRDFEDDTLSTRHAIFSRSDLILEANEWHQKIIAKISDYIDCDSLDETVRKHSVKTLIQELSFADHLLNGYVLIKLKSERSINLARIVSRQIKSNIICGFADRGNIICNFYCRCCIN